MPASFTPNQEKRRKKWRKIVAFKLLVKAKQTCFKRRFRFLIGFHSLASGLKKTSSLFFVSKPVAKYWGKKFLSPNTFHPQSHGGARNWKWSHEKRIAFETTLWRILKTNPTLSGPQIVFYLNQFGFEDVQSSFVYHTLRRWRWSLKRPTRRQLQKYSQGNLLRYVRYVVGIFQIPIEKIKYLDEAHFVSRELQAKRAWGETGEKTYVLTNANLKTSYSLTVLTRLDSPESTVVADIRTNSNTQWDFLNFIIYCIQSGSLKTGDYLVMDNATVHVGSESWDLIVGIFEAAGIFPCFLPCYSPELNAAEYVFHVVKEKVRRNRSPSDHFWMDTIIAVAQITQETMWSFYRKALFDWLRDIKARGLE